MDGNSRNYIVYRAGLGGQHYVARRRLSDENLANAGWEGSESYMLIPPKWEYQQHWGETRPYQI